MLLLFVLLVQFHYFCRVKDYQQKERGNECSAHPFSGKKAMQCAAARSLLFAFSEFGPTIWLHFNAVRFQFGCLQAPARERCQFSNEHVVRGDRKSVV